jgi:hypothetical protein
MPSRRRVLAATTLVAASAAGCADLAPSDARDDRNGVDDPGATDAVGTDESTDTPTETVPGHEEAAQEPDPDLPITVENRDEEPHSLTLTVARGSGEVVHESVEELDPVAEYEAYNLRQADPDGVERFQVAIEAGGSRREITVRTNECYGDVRVGFESSGELFATYVIC